MLAIFTWRLLAKSTLHTILPPTFRFLATLFQLPNRRFYTPATDYTNVPLSPDGGLRPIPSVIDLPGTSGVGVEMGGIGSGMRPVWKGRRELVRMRGNANAKSSLSMYTNGTTIEEQKASGEKGVVKHYDADGVFSIFLILFLECSLI